jgi:class 3 adenylate cyclase
MTTVPTTEYARSGDVHIAFQVVGTSATDLVWRPSWASHLEMMWDDPLIPAFVAKLARFARVVMLDQRGVGLSDPVSLADAPGIDPWVEDLGAVLDAAGSKSAFVAAADVASFVAILFAAAHPERTRGLIIVNGTSCVRRFDDYPVGLSAQAVDAFLAAVEHGWGREDSIFTQTRRFEPSVSEDAGYQTWLNRYRRATASPGTMVAMTRLLMDTDVRGVLGSIRVPTLVIHRRDDQYFRVGHGRFLAEHIPNATYIELDGRDHAPEFGDTTAIMAAMEEFVTGEPPVLEPDRMLATLVFTDIAGSTELAARLGDDRWTTLLERHDQIVQRQAVRFGGRIVKSTGDGVLALFDGPARAVQCAVALRDALRAIELNVRTGIHTGEVEDMGHDVAGIAVHIAARVSALAPAGEIYVSRTVRDLVAGSQIRFEDLGGFALKGVPDTWQLLRVVSS